MATTTRQTVRRGAPPPKGRLNGAGVVPVVRDVSSPTKGSGPLVQSRSDSGQKAANNPFLAPFTIFMYGIPGVGKSSMWAHLPDVAYLHDPQEEGILELVRFGQVPKPRAIEVAEDWQMLQDKLAAFANREFKGVQHLVIESATGFEKFCFRHHCSTHFEDNWGNGEGGFYSFYKGPKQAAKTDWPDFLQAIDEVRRSGIGVVFIGHSEVKNFDNPGGQDYSRYVPTLDKETWAQTHRWAQTVLFYDLLAEVAKEPGQEKNKMKKAKVYDYRRVIYSSPVGPAIAKSWWGLEPIIDAGDTPKQTYDNFLAAYKKAAKKGGAL